MKNDNLKKGNPATQFRSGREAAEAGRKGGVKSGEERRRRKTLQEATRELLDRDVTDAEAKKILGGYFPDDDEETTNMTVMLVGVLKKAIRGDIRAVEYITRIIGEDAETMSKADEQLLKREMFEYQKEQDGSFGSLLGGWMGKRAIDEK